MPPKQPDADLERVFDSPSLNGPVPRCAKLSPDGRYLALLRNRPTDRSATTCGRSTGRPASGGCWSIPRSSAAARAHVRSRKDAARAQGHRQPQGHRHLRLVGGRQVDPRAARRRCSTSPASTAAFATVKRRRQGRELNPVLSETGKYLSFLRDNRLWAGRVGGEVKPITPSEGDARPLGRGRVRRAGRDGPRRPAIGGRRPIARIAVERFDEAPVGVVTRAAIGAEGTTTFEQRYPAAGTANVDVAAVRRSIRTAATRSRSISAPNRDIYLDARRLGARRQDALRPAREPRPDHARHARGRSGDRQEPRAVQREGGAAALDQSVRRLQIPQGRQPDLVVRARRLRPSLPLRATANGRS